MSKTIEIVASYSGTVNTGNYNNESPFFSIKEVIEDWQGTDEEAQERHFELAMECYEKFWEFKEEAQKPMIVKTYKHKAECTAPQMEKIRLEAIRLITEDVKWINENGYKEAFREWWQEFTKEEYAGDLKNVLGFMGSRAVNRSLNVFVKNLKEKEKE